MNKNQEIELLETFVDWKSINGINFISYSEDTMLADTIKLVNRSYIEVTSQYSEPYILGQMGEVIGLAPDVEFHTTTLGLTRLNELKGTLPQPVSPSITIEKLEINDKSINTKSIGILPVTQIATTDGDKSPAETKIPGFWESIIGAFTGKN